MALRIQRSKLTLGIASLLVIGAVAYPAAVATYSTVARALTSPSIVVNEFNANGSSDWVELYNTSSSSVDVTGWILRDSSTSPMKTLAGSIAPHGFMVIEVGNRLNQENDGVTILDKNGTVIDSLIYNTSGAILYPPAGKTTARTTDGGPTWAVGSPTKGGSNGPAVPSDVTPPTKPEGGAPHKSFVNTNNFYFTWNPSTDVEGGNIQYEFQSSLNPAQSGGVLTSNVWKSGRLTEPKIHSTGAPDGTWYWQVRAIDQAGNASPWSTIWDMVIDTNAPDVTIDAPTERFVNGPVTVSGTATDVNMQRYNFVIKDVNDNIIAGPGDVNASSVASWQWDASTVADGDYEIRLQAWDKAGNTDAGSLAQRLVTVDRTAPTVVITSPTVGQVVGGKSFDISGTVKDKSGLVDYKYQLFDGSMNAVSGIMTGTSVVEGGSLGTIDIENVPSGRYVVRVWTTDPAGNNAAAEASFEIDHTAPSVTVGYSGTGTPSANTPITLTGKVGESPVASLKLFIDGTEIADLTNMVGGDGTWSYVLQSGLVKGTYEIMAVATDAYGNVSSIVSSPASVMTLAVSAFIPPVAATISPEVTTRLLDRFPVISTPQRIAVSAPTIDDESTEDNETAVLGSETDSGLPLKEIAESPAIAASESGWKIFGIAWYWWLLLLAAVASVIWWMTATRRNREEAI